MSEHWPAARCERCGVRGNWNGEEWSKAGRLYKKHLAKCDTPKTEAR